MTGRSSGLTGSLLLAIVVSACSSSAAGRPKAEYDQETGRLRRLTFDANKNGRDDGVSVMDGARVAHIELDTDEDGKIDRWDFYREGQSLERVGLSRLDDGVMDSQAFFGPAGELARIEVSTGRDGRFNRIEWYEAGTLVRSEEDTNGDGRSDKWETYRRNPQTTPNEPPYAIASVAFDDVGSGTPQRRVIYDESGRTLRVETLPAAGSLEKTQAVKNR